MDDAPSSLPPPLVLPTSGVPRPRKRISPTLLPPLPVDGVDSTTDALEPPKPSRARKRKGRPEDIIDDAEASLSTEKEQVTSFSTQPAKRRKRQAGKYSRENLAPFDFFLVQPPSAYGSFYTSLCEWIVGIVNEDYALMDKPFVFDIATHLPHLTKGQKDSLGAIMKILADPAAIQDAWSKITIIDKLLCLAPEEEWKEGNLPWLKYQTSIWWVKAGLKWFEQPNALGTWEDYLHRGLAGLILELWYRFIWCRHTTHVYHQLQLAQTSQQSQDSAPLATDALDDDEILEPEELGEGEEEESEEDEETDGNSEEDTDMDVELASFPPEIRNVALPTPLSVGKPLSAEISIPTQGDVDAASTIAVSGTPPPQFSNGMAGSDDDNPADSTLLLLTEGQASDLLPSLSKLPDSDVDTGASELPAEPIVWDNEEQNEPSSAASDQELPAAIPVFFLNSGVRSIIDEVESVVLAKEGEWAISKVLDAFVDVVDHRNKDAKVAHPPTRKTIRNRVDHLYKIEFVPFVKLLGLRVHGENERTWSLPEAMEPLYDGFLTTMFVNITQNGTATSRTFLQLFPKLVLSSEPRSQIYLSDVSDHIHRSLIKKGTLTPELEGLLNILDTLIDEKNELLKKSVLALPENDDDDDDYDEKKPASIVSITTQHHTIMQQIQSSREKRLKEIDQLMETIRDELNKHTGNVDKLESRKRKKLKSLGIAPPDTAASSAAAAVADAEAMLVAKMDTTSVQ